MISQILHVAFTFMYHRGKSILFWDSDQLTIQKLRVYARAISEKVGRNVPLQGIIGFIDGTFRECARPTHNQQADYNGWKHSHGTKYQGVMAPDGMFVHLGGPFRATWHDCKILRQSRLEATLDLVVGQHHSFRLYGDAAYGSRFPWVVASLKRSQLTSPELRRQNIRMASARVVVEWGFGRVVKYVL